MRSESPSAIMVKDLLIVMAMAAAMVAGLVFGLVVVNRIDPSISEDARLHRKFVDDCHASGKAIVKDEYNVEFCVAPESLGSRRVEVVYQ